MLIGHPSNDLIYTVRAKESAVHRLTERAMMRDHIIQGKQGRYKLIDVRGSGSMSTVYIGRDLNSNRLFAVKVLRPEMAGQDEILSRFAREADILTSLTDRHIVRPLEYGHDGTLHYVVMDYIDGSTLKEMIFASGPLPVETALDLARQAAEGLDAAYKKQVVHRDIKPQNILVTTTNVVKLTDFGLARTTDSSTITKDGSFLGTPHYVAPEQASDSHQADVRSDLYSLGGVLFEMLTGQVPYDGKHAMEVLLMQIQSPIPSACRLRPDLPQAFDLFLQKALAKSPLERFQTPQEFIQALATLAREPGIKSTPRVSGVAESTIPATLTLLATGQVIGLTEQQTLIGRHDPLRPPPHVDLTTLDTSRMVSRSQARILRHDGRFFVEDLKPRNPTKLNNVQLEPFVECELHEGDTLRVGSIAMRFNIVNGR